MASGVLVTAPREQEHEPARGRVAALLARVRWPLVAIVAVGAALTIWFVLQCVQYFIQPDELEYLKQSRQIFEGLHPLVPGDAYYTSWSQLQPLLLAPVWGLIHDTNSAHQVMGVVNALIMASAAIPAYLLTLRVVADRRLGYLVALLTVLVPWMASASTMMTEVAAYPAFLWSVLAVHHAISRPSPRGDLIGVLGVGLAYFARPQLVVIAAALVGGLIVQELRYASAGADPTAPRRERLGRGLRAGRVRQRDAPDADQVGARGRPRDRVLDGEDAPQERRVGGDLGHHRRRRRDPRHPDGEERDEVRGPAVGDDAPGEQVGRDRRRDHDHRVDEAHELVGEVGVADRPHGRQQERLQLRPGVEVAVARQERPQLLGDQPRLLDVLQLVGLDEVLHALQHEPDRPREAGPDDGHQRPADAPEHGGQATGPRRRGGRGRADGEVGGHRG